MARKCKKIGIYGGSFDPVHLGHVAICVALKEAHNLDQIFIIPALSSPHKMSLPPVAAKHRFAMCKKAFVDLPYCQVLDLEIRRQGPSYTIDTIHELLSSGLVSKNDELYLLMGQDQAAVLPTWKNVHELLKVAPPLIARRAGDNIDLQDKKLLRYIKKGLTNTPYYDISATNIRKRLKNGQYSGHMLDRRVSSYIQRHHLYE